MNRMWYLRKSVELTGVDADDAEVVEHAGGAEARAEREWGQNDEAGASTEVATQRTTEPSRQPDWAHIKSTRRAIVAEPTEPCWRAAGARQQWAGRRLRLAERRGRG